MEWDSYPTLKSVGDGDAVLPSWDKVREAVGDLFNNACKATVKTKYATWISEVSKASWEVLEPAFLWPGVGTEEIHPNDDEHDDEGRESAIQYMAVMTK